MSANSIQGVPNNSNQARPIAANSTKTDTPLAMYRNQIAEALDVSDSVRARHKVNDLRLAYTKYTAFQEAKSKLAQMVADGTWELKSSTGELKIPSTGDLISVFISTSSWYAGYNVFAKVDNHPEMKSWLEGSLDMGNLELWGFNKTTYSFKDLEAYFWRKGDREPLDGKGKIAAKGKGKGKGKDPGSFGEGGSKKGKRKAAASVSEGSGKKRKDKKRKEVSDDEESSSSS